MVQAPAFILEEVASDQTPDFDVNLAFYSQVYSQLPEPFAKFYQGTIQKAEDLDDLSSPLTVRMYYGEFPFPDSKHKKPVVIQFLGPKFHHADLSILSPPFSRQRKGPFNTAFEALYRASQGLGTLDLKRLADYLSQTGGRESDTFEAFGVKFPASDFAQWGILLLICVQLYFWVHIHEIRGRLRADDPRWDVAWIGVYQTTFSKFVFCLSMFLPGLAIIFLTKRMVFVVDGPSFSVLLIVALIPLSLCLTVITLKHMPDAKEPYIAFDLSRLRHTMANVLRSRRLAVLVVGTCLAFIVILIFLLGR